jgi:hypothetical protein
MLMSVPITVLPSLEVYIEVSEVKSQRQGLASKGKN